MPKLLSLKDKLIQEHACPEAIKWVNSKSKRSAWNWCKHDDWMMWFLDRIVIDKESIALAIYEMIETEMSPLDVYAQKAIGLGKKWLKREISLETFRYNYHEFKKKDIASFGSLILEIVNPDSMYCFIGLYDDVFYRICQHHEIRVNDEDMRAPLEKRLCAVIRKHIPSKVIEKAKWKK